MSRQVVLEPIVQEQAGVLQNMVELYAHDFSEHVPLDLKPDGRFHVSVGDRWWTTEGHHPFFIRCAEKLVGFVLVRKGSRITGADDVMDVAELFVVRGARKKKVGMQVAHALFEAFPSRWEMRVRRSNVAALRFWSRTAKAWSGTEPSSTPVLVDGVDWDVLRIDSSVTRDGA